MFGFSTLSMWMTRLLHGRKTKFMNEVKRYQKYDIGICTYGFPEIRQWTGNTRLEIGKYCAIAPEVTFLLGGEHDTSSISSYPFSGIFLKSHSPQKPEGTKGDIKVGNDVWIGLGALILSGVTIGDGAVIGAGSVVAKNVEPYAIVAGNPAKLLRYRFTRAQIKHLLGLRWWDWPDEAVRQAQPLLEGSDFNAFRKFAVTQTKK